MSLAEDFLADVKNSDKSEATESTYRSHVGSFQDWCEENGVNDLTDVEHRHIHTHLNEMNGDGYAGKYIKTRLATLRSFYGFLVNMQIIDRDENPCRHLDGKDYGSTQSERDKLVTEEEDRYLSFEQINDLAENVPDPTACNELMVRLQFETCVRAGELARMKVETVDPSKREITVQSLKKKNGRVETRKVWFYTDRTEELLRQWLNRGHRSAFATAYESPYLFPREKRERPRTQDVNTMIVQAAKNAGWQEVIGQDAKGRDRYLITSHMLRHSGISFLLNECEVPIRDVKSLAGHEQLEQTLEYVHRTTDARREEIMKKTANV